MTSSSTSKSKAQAMLFFLLMATATATTPLYPSNSSYVVAAAAAAAAAADPPTSAHHIKKKTTTSSKNLLDVIGNKFESAVIATHYAILQKAKEEEKYDHDEELLLLASSSATASSSSDVDGAAAAGGGLVVTEVPTNEPTPSSSWNTYEPTVWNTYEPTAWDDDGYTSQGNDDMKEAEESISSPTPLPSSFPTLLIKKSLTPTSLSIMHTDTDMDSPTLINTTASTTMPTETEDSTSPSHAITSLLPSHAPSQHITQSPTVDETLTKTATSIPSIVPDNDQDCPEIFDEAAFYLEDDVISVQGPQFCRRSNECRIIYKCSVPTFCNVVVPGKEHSEEGWLKIGYCEDDVTSSLSDENITSMEEEQVVITDQLSSSFPKPSHAVNDVTTGSEGTEDALGEEEAVPTSRPTSWQFGFNPLPAGNDQNTDHNSAISVDTPKIICDISLSSSLTVNFEQKHVLLVVMTKTIHDIFESHLSKELYDLTGISLSVSTEKNQDDSNSSTIRMHAFFSGTASFSLFAPTQSELIELLLLHFDVEAFNDRLKLPLRLRILEEEPVVKVNSVFFTLEDGPLVNAGYKSTEEFALPAIASSQDGKEAGITVHQIQIMTVFFVVAALPFVLVAVVLIMLRYVDEEEKAYLEADDESTDEPAMPEVDEEEVSPATVDLDKSVTAAHSVKLEIDVRMTPSARMLLSDISESQSEWSSISDSFHDYRNIESPAKVGLGITAAGHNYHPSPYVSQAAAIGLVPELWEHDDHLEVYEDYIIDV